MLPTRLNFLPKEKQKHLHQAIMGTVTTRMMETILLCVSVCTIALLCGYMFIEGYFRSIAESAASVEPQHTEQIQTIRQAHSLIENTYAIEKQTTLLTPMIQDITESIPAQVSLEHLSIDMKKKEVTLSGVAQTRDAYLTLETALKGVPFLDSVQIPLSDLTEKTNIAFSFSVKIQ